MQIGEVTIERISGPSSFAFLIPTRKLYNDTKNQSLKYLMLLGDLHHTRDHVCKNCDFDCLMTHNDGWFKLLDFISTQEHPIDYYIEIEIAKDYLDSVDYLDEIQKNVDRLTIAYHIARNHISCFQSSDICFTENIRYHAIDIRSTNTIEIDYSKFKPANNKYETYLRKMRGPYRTVYSLESIIIGEVKRFMFTSDADYFFKVDYHNAVSIKNLLSLACTNWTLFVDTLLDIILDDRLLTEDEPLNIRCGSLGYLCKPIILKQVKKQANKNIDWKQFCREYYLFADKYLHLQDSTIDERRKAVLALANSQADFHKRFIDSVTINGGSRFKNESFFNQQYQDIIKEIVRSCFSPLLDLYFMLRSWKITEDKPERNNNPSWLTVLNAGNHHTDMLTYFLVYEKKYYKFPDDITNCAGVIGVAYTEFSKHALTVHETSKKQCIEFKTCLLNLDKYNPNKEQIRSLNLRWNVFGSHKFYDMLVNNNFISMSEVRKFINVYLTLNEHSKYKDIDTVFSDLQLKVRGISL